MVDQSGEDFILGIDLGANSLGWALVAREDGQTNQSPSRQTVAANERFIPSIFSQGYMKGGP